MKTTAISIQNTGATLTMADEPNASWREDKGQHCVRITLPDGREFRYVDNSGAVFEDIVELSERDGVWDARFGFIPVDGSDKTGRDHYEEEMEFASRDLALSYGLERARELGVPLIEKTWPGEIGDAPVYVCLFQPTQVIVADRLGEVTFTARNGRLVPDCDAFSDECSAVGEIIFSDGIDPKVLAGLVSEAWAAPCAVTVRRMPVLNSEVKGVPHVE